MEVVKLASSLRFPFCPCLKTLRLAVEHLSHDSLLLQLLTFVSRSGKCFLIEVLWLLFIERLSVDCNVFQNITKIYCRPPLAHLWRTGDPLAGGDIASLPSPPFYGWTRLVGWARKWVRWSLLWNADFPPCKLWRAAAFGWRRPLVRVSQAKGGMISWCKWWR